MKILLFAAILMLAGCYNYELNERCKALYGSEWIYNQIADKCGAPNPNFVMPPIYLNQPAPSHQPFVATPLPPPPPRCISQVVGNQIQTTCY